MSSESLPSLDHDGQGDLPLVPIPREDDDKRPSNYARTYPDSEDESEDEDARATLLNASEFGPLSPKLHAQDHAPEKWELSKRIIVEASPTLLFAVFGMVFSGELLQRVSTWTAFRSIDELILLIPIIIGLKGNVEMNLSSRLGTAANMGLLNLRSNRRSIVAGNLILLQVQALIVSAVAAALAFVFGLTMPKEKITVGGDPSARENAAAIATAAAHHHVIERGFLYQLRSRQNPPSQVQAIPRVRTLWSWFREFFMVLTTAMGSASLSGLILGSFMCALVLICQKYRLNPDNIAPPIAACLGDLLTLTLLALSSTALRYMPSPIPLLLLISLGVLAALLVRATSQNTEVKHLLYKGWTPLFTAMIISSGAGMILDKFVKKYEGYGLLATVISSLPGSLGAVSISRLSTLLHASSDVPQQGPGIASFSFSMANYPPTHRPMLSGILLRRSYNILGGGSHTASIVLEEWMGSRQLLYAHSFLSM
ncbi:hypothetical protein FRB93_012013 [Tulasnella sp. JGI-2019a]|nr:hypothetical protein FRB93_012013 [Tulasnella sp. JGI-2019a]